MDKLLNKKNQNDEIIIAREINKRIPEKYRASALKIKNIYEKAIKYTNNEKGYAEKYLDMGVILKEIKLCPEFSITKTIDKTISQDNFNLSKISNDIIGFINNEYSILLPQTTIKNYKKSILASFANRGSNFTYELLFKIDENSNVLSSIITNLKFDIIEKKKKILGITVKKTKVYKISIKSFLINNYM